MLLRWQECGFSYREFWRLTPRETDLIMRGHEFATIRKHNEAMVLAWQIANLSRAKKLPAVKSLIVSKAYRRQTWQEQLAIMKALTRANTDRKRRNG